MNRWWTSDNHFRHKNIAKFCPKTRQGITDVTKMDAKMIEIWNDTVADDDLVYTLGDFCFGGAQYAESILQQLKGRKILILGNHDQWYNKNLGTKYFEFVGYYKKEKIDGHSVIMFHYPIYEWENMQYGSFHLYGHVHGNVIIPGRALDVGIDAREQCDMGLWSWEDIKDYMMKQEIRSHH